MRKKVAILFSGGDSQGMNMVLKTIVNMCHLYNIDIIGVKRGFTGLIENDLMPLTNDMVQNVSDEGGCYLKVARSKEFETINGQKKALEVLKKNKIDFLVTVGGNGTYNGALALIKNGVKVIAIPGTIDNDLFYTDRTLGFDTAVNNAVNAIDMVRQTMEANDRATIFEVMGRNCGDIALNVAVATQAHSVAVSETNSTINDIVSDVNKCLESKVTLSPIVVVSENTNLNIIDVEKALKEKLGIETRSMVLSYLLRGGAPSVEDRIFATQLGIKTVELINENAYNLALGIKNNKVIAVDLLSAINTKQNFNFELLKKLRSLYNLN